jgi:hypothetical protein
MVEGAKAEDLIPQWATRLTICFRFFIYFFFDFLKVNAPKIIYQIYTYAAISYGGRIQTSYHTVAGSVKRHAVRCLALAPTVGAGLPCHWAQDPSTIWHDARVPNAIWHNVWVYRRAIRQQLHAYISNPRLPLALPPFLPSPSLSSPRWSSRSTSDTCIFLFLASLIYKL